LRKHPTTEQIRSLVRCECERADAAAVLLHVLSGCGRCWAQLLNVLILEEDAVKGVDYEAVIRRATARALQGARARDREVRIADQTFADFLDVIDGEERDEGPRVEGWALCEKLLSLSESYRHKDARQMLRYACYARLVFGRIELADYPAPLRTDFEARLSAEIANAYRVNDELDEADSHMREAEQVLSRGTGDILLRARVLDLKASLRNSQRRFAESRHCLRLAYTLYRRAGETHLAGKTLITRGLFAGYDGDPEHGLRLVDQGLRKIEPERDPTLLAIALHTRVRLLNECGRFREALLALGESELRRRLAGDRLNLLKLRWEEGRTAAGLGDLEEAASAFEEVRRGFEARELPYKTALVALDLAAVRLRQGRTAQELAPLVRELVATFRACRIGREAIAALLLLREVCERERLTLELLRSVATFLHQHERDPGATFEYLPVT
jgi:hypothetical protein